MNKRKAIKLGITLSSLLVALLIAYIFILNPFRTTQSSLQSTAIFPDEMVITDKLGIQNSFGKEHGLLKPQGIAYHEGKLYVSDTENDRIVILTTQGEMIKEIGRTGNAPGELIKPRGITADRNGNILVVDSGNNRVQIFDASGTYQQQIVVNEFSTPYKGSEFLRDVEVDSFGHIYISTFAYYKERQNIYIYKDDQFHNKIPTHSTGMLSYANDQIFYLADFELLVTGEERKLVPGQTFLNIVTDKELSQSFRLNDGSLPKSIVFHNNHYYLLYKPMPHIDIFNGDYTYVETAYANMWENRADYTGFTDMVADNNGNLYCVDDENNQISVLTRHH